MPRGSDGRRRSIDCAIIQAFSTLKAIERADEGRAGAIIQQSQPHDHAGENPHLARTPEKETKRQGKGGSVHGGARVCADLFGRFSCSLISGCKKLNSCGRAVQGTVVLYLFIFPYEQTTLLLLLVLDNRVYYCCHEGKLETYVHGQTVVV